MTRARRPELPPRLPRDAHKGTAGRVAALCGSREMPGAALLVARAAQRAGAGLVAMGCLDANLLLLLPSAAPEAVLLDLTRRARSPRAAAREFLAWPAHARLLGPGLGAGPRTRALVEAVLAQAGAEPLVLDADALNALGSELAPLRARRGLVVLTPHPGEAARLLGREVPGDDAGRQRCALELARASGAIVVLKGRGTLVAGGRAIWRCTRGNPGMATAGAGDVLAGIAAAYLAAACAQGAALDAFELVAGAVEVHARAGDRAARSKGERGAIASDLIDELPAVQRALGR